MKSNILIAGFVKSINDDVAKELADSLNMYYLSLSDLTLYYANRASKKEVLLEGGEALYNKFLKFALKDAKEFENTLTSLDMNDVSASELTTLLDTSLVIFLGASYRTVEKSGAEVKKEDILYSRQKYSGCYDIYIGIDGIDKNTIKEKIISEITSYYGG